MVKINKMEIIKKIKKINKYKTDLLKNQQNGKPFSEAKKQRERKR